LKAPGFINPLVDYEVKTCFFFLFFKICFQQNSTRTAATRASAPAPANNLFGAVPDTGEVARRVMQRNTAWATLTLVIVVAVLVVRTVSSTIRTAVAVALPGFFSGRRKAEGNPSFDVVGLCTVKQVDP
jgi:hypothetical protein